MIITWIIATAVFAVDFWLKSYLYSNFSFQSIPLIKNIFHITLVLNTGAAFGILQNNSNFLIFISIFFILILIFLVNYDKIKSKLFLIACGLIIGGALSNLWDRIFLGYVIDYIDLRIWPVFNVSDSCITIGASFLLWDSFQRKNKKQNENDKKNINC